MLDYVEKFPYMGRITFQIQILLLIFASKIVHFVLPCFYMLIFSLV